MKKEEIIVLLSSYNGEKYIEEQIETILAQEGVVVKLFVRDDGSNDRTPQILERYKKEGKLDYYVGENLGWRNSFMRLVVDAPDGDYYAFADQDDHWLPEKLKKAVECMKTMPRGPQLYNSNGSLWKDGEIVGKVSTIKPELNRFARFINPLGQGSTQVFNRDMQLLVKKHIPQIEVPHDAWFARLAILLGGYHYDYNSYILYRQHDNNQIGADTNSKERLHTRFKKYASISKLHYLDIVAKEMIKCYGDIMDKESYQICYTIANYREKASCTLRLLLSPNYKCDNWLQTFGFRYRVLMRMI